MRSLILLACLCLLVPFPALAQERPYFVTYDHHLEEPGDLEISWMNTVGVQRNRLPTYWAPFVELEYGVTHWWTSELYLEGQSRSGDSTIFTGWRLENRFRPLAREHRVNPILYFEFEDINEASRIQKEVVGHAEPLEEPNAVLRGERAREVEMKLILSSQVRDWNIAENFIVEKSLSEDEGFEFGYGFGVSRPLASLASARACRFCRENFTAGVEFYGGLGSSDRFGLADTAHYAAPVIAWQVSNNASVHFSPAFGLTGKSERLLLRFGYSYEVEGFGRKVRRLFRGGKP